jgi:catechol 2,3-dioxygenase-like lactoylglutathione lyase family enzyme
MNKSLVSLLVVILLGAVALAMPSLGRSAAFHDGDYARIGVPNLPQAVAFFRDVLDCQPVDPISVEGARQSRLMACDSDSIVELFDDHGTASPSPAHRAGKRDEPLRFVSSDVRNADQWLRSAGVRVIGSPHTLRSGPDAGQTAVDFMSPWGLRLQLVSLNSNVAAVGP